MEDKRCPMCDSVLTGKGLSRLEDFHRHALRDSRKVLAAGLGLAVSVLAAIFLVAFLFAMAGTPRSTIGVQNAVFYVCLLVISCSFADKVYLSSRWWQPAVLGGLIFPVLASAAAAVVSAEIAGSFWKAVPAGVTLAASTLFFAFLYRRTRLSLRFTSFREIAQGVEILGCSGRFDTALCGECGNRVPVASIRPLGVFYKRRYRYFCSSCKAFIRGNPVRHLAYGMLQVTGVWLFLAAALVGRVSPSSVPANILLVFLAVVMTLDGVFRAWHGMVGVLRFLSREKTPLVA